MRYLKPYIQFNESLFSIRKEGVEKVMNQLLNDNFAITENDDDIEYEINDDLSININSDLDIIEYKVPFIKMPIKLNLVDGSLDCSRIGLETLENFPNRINGDFDCHHNNLTSLEFAPKEITGRFNCHDNKITSLKNISNYFTDNGDNIWIYNNPVFDLITLVDKQIDTKSHTITTSQNMKELLERMEEFEVVKDGNKLDLISMNSVYDYYDVEFDEDDFKNIKGYEIY